MKRNKTKIFPILVVLLVIENMSFAEGPYSGSVPKTISIQDTIFRDHFIVISPLYSDSLRFVFRTENKLYALAHHGTPMWNVDISLPFNASGHGGTIIGAADVDSNGVIEIVTLNDNNEIKIYDGLTGSLENTWLVTVGSGQIAGHIVIVNLRGEGERDAIVQTVDADGQDGGDFEYYINRSLIAVNLEDGSQIWRVEQDDNVNSPTGYGPYEGYFGQAHGGLICGDVDNDGLDEVVGGSIIDDDGAIIDPGYKYFWEHWVVSNDSYVDHLDCIAIGDFRPDLYGLEWVVTEEDHLGGGWLNFWYTVLFRYNTATPSNGRLWSRESWELFPDGSDREPQNVAVGNFDTGRSYSEVWARSRFGGTQSHAQGEGQYPWMFDKDTTLVTHYAMETVLPSGFNDLGNGEGVEIIWTIDWDGGNQEYIAAQARHTESNVGVFDAKTGADVWYTGASGDYGAVQSYYIYVADIGGDSREEVIVCDVTNTPPELKIYWNSAVNPNDPPKPNKWNDPLYRRLKQMSNYYSPGSYTYREPVKKKIKIFLEGPYNASGDSMSTSLHALGLIPTTSPYVEDPRIADAIPDGVTDWILVQLRKTASGDPIVSRSVFLRNDGYAVMENGSTDIEFFVEDDNYFIVLRQRNHLDVMSNNAVAFGQTATTYDFTTAETQFEGTNGAVELETGVWGMWAGDGNGDGGIYGEDYLLYRTNLGTETYIDIDYNMDGGVYGEDYIIYKINLGSESTVP